MARLSEKERVKRWEDRIAAADKVHKKWADTFKVKNLEEYYLGKQWRGLTEDDAQSRYVINLVFSTIETNKPSLIFQNPQVRMSARPGRSDDFGSQAQERALLCQDTAQTFIDDPDVDFVPETSLSLHEAHFRFGVVEVGYTPDWIDNPDAGKPVLKLKENPGDEDEVVTDSKNQPVLQGESVVTRESLYIKRIPAEAFRVSISNKNKLSRNDWCGYYEWHYVDDLRENPLYEKGARGLKSTGSMDGERDKDVDNTPEGIKKRAGMVKVWKIWDLRTMTRIVLAAGHDKFLMENQSYKYVPFSVLKWYEILDSFYPCPPVFQWLGPQDEVNETRDAQRAHRRRFYRRYTIIRNTVDPEELKKLESGGDGVYIEVDQGGAIQPIADAPLSSDVWQHLDESKTDFLTVSGVSGDQRGVAESETATQATIIDQHSQLREGSIRAKVQSWLADIARLILLTARDNMALEFWIRRNVDLSAIEANGGSEVMRVNALWQQIENDELGDLDLDISIDLSSMSPVAKEAEKQSWMQVLAMISNPGLQMMLGMSDVLLKKTLSLYGITSQTEIVEIKKVIGQIMMMQMAAAKAQAEGAGGPVKPGGAAPPAGGKPKTKPGETPAEMGGTTVQ